MDLIVIKMLYAKDKKKKKKGTDWEKIFANHMSNIHNELSRLSSKKTNNPVRKLATDLNRYFTRVDVWIASKYVKKKKLFGI